MSKKSNPISDKEACDLVEEKGYSAAEFKDWLNTNDSCDKNGALHAYVNDFLSYKNDLKTLVIDESNFNDYFFDVKTNKPRPGQVLACYESMAEFVDGDLKRDIIKLLTRQESAEVALKLTQKTAGATKESSIALVKSMVSDLMSGMSDDEVAAKPYEFHCRYFYYTYRGCIPTNDTCWWSTALIDVAQKMLESGED